MMGERSAQDRLFAADHIYLDDVGRDTLYGYLAQHRGQLFRDEDFAILYCRNNGRPSVPPSLAVSILFLRAYDGVSFVEAIERTKYDLRWKVALGLEMEEIPMQKSALQEFQARTICWPRGSKNWRCGWRRSPVKRSPVGRRKKDCSGILGAV